jgi:hypothetical protein
VVAAAAGYGTLNAVAGLLVLPVLVLAAVLVLRRPAPARV